MVSVILVPSWSFSKAVCKPVWHIWLLSVQWITPDDGQRNCLKHVVSFQNKFEKLVHLVGFITSKKRRLSSEDQSLLHMHETWYCKWTLGQIFLIYYLNDEFLWDLFSPVRVLARWLPDIFVVNYCIKILLIKCKVIWQWFLAAFKSIFIWTLFIVIVFK
jgi:hypothetical protein